MKWKGTCPSGKSWSPDQVRARNQGFEGSASFEDHEAGTLALGVGVVTDDAHVVVGVCAVASLELTDNDVQILLTEEGELPIRPVGGHGVAGVDVLDERAPTLGNDVGDLVVDLRHSKSYKRTAIFVAIPSL